MSKITEFQLRIFVDEVAKGKQEGAEHLLLIDPTRIQEMLTSVTTCTDYSGRTFNCTAYEYAYWAMDTHMCRMLEKHMDEDTKRIMKSRCDAIEQNGLTYTQNGKEITGSKHFDFTELKSAYKNCLDNFSWDDMSVTESNCIKIGLAQQNVPAHVAQEYCRKSRPFNSTSKFDEDILPRELDFANNKSYTGVSEVWFPLNNTEKTGLGVSFAIFRISSMTAGDAFMDSDIIESNFKAIINLERKRTADLEQSKENLETQPLVHRA